MKKILIGVIMFTLFNVFAIEAKSCPDFINTSGQYYNGKLVKPFSRYRDRIRVCGGFYRIVTAPSQFAPTIQEFNGVGDTYLDVVGAISEDIEGESEMKDVYYLTEWSWQQYQRGNCPNWVYVSADNCI